MHHAQSQLRAIETGRYVVRSANTGISSVISDKGEVLRSLDALKTGYVLEAVRLSERGTAYSIIGNLFAYLCLAACGAGVLMTVVERTMESARVRGTDRREKMNFL
jgi:apolipoprotein N-acyltransferase